MNSITINPIGFVEINDDGFALRIASSFRPGLKELAGFSHIHVLFWCHYLDTEEYRRFVTCPKPYRDAPETVGVFATRSPVRPNPLGLSICPVLDIQAEEGLIRLAYVDAEDGSPVVDLKPYHPAVDRVRDAGVPAWCSHWPRWYEDAATFDWEAEFVNAR